MASLFYVPHQKFSLWDQLCCQFDDRQSQLKRFNHVFHYPNELESHFRGKIVFFEQQNFHCLKNRKPANLLLFQK